MPFIKCFLTREDALIQPEEDEKFRYENGWPFLEVLKNGKTSQFINKNSIVHMWIDELPPEMTLEKFEFKQEKKVFKEPEDVIEYRM